MMNLDAIYKKGQMFRRPGWQSGSYITVEEVNPLVLSRGWTSGYSEYPLKNFSLYINFYECNKNGITLINETTNKSKGKEMKNEKIEVEVKVNGDVVVNGVNGETKAKTQLENNKKWVGIFYSASGNSSETKHFDTKKEAKKELGDLVNIGKTLVLYRKTVTLTTSIPIVEVK